MTLVLASCIPNTADDQLLLSLLQARVFNGSCFRGSPPKRWSDQIRYELKTPLLTLEKEKLTKTDENSLVESNENLIQEYVVTWVK